MRKTFLIIACCLFIGSVASAQEKPASSLTAKDSADVLNELMSLIDTASDKTTSYALLNVGIGNRLFSLHNNSLNAKQNSTSTLIISPSLGYYHKSGLSISAGVNMLKDTSGGFGVNQYSITPAYDLLTSKKIDFGISYTRYFVEDKYSQYSSPIQNDIYTYLTYKKSWIQPGVALGYSTGQYKQAAHRDTVIGTVTRHLYDSVTNDLKTFSFIVSATHHFNWYAVLGKTDLLSFTPTLLANTGSSNVAITHKTNSAIVNRLIKKGKVPKFTNSGFEFQSIGLNLDLAYSVGDFTFEPQAYFDYYLPNTSDAKRFTSVFTFNIGYSF